MEDSKQTRPRLGAASINLYVDIAKMVLASAVDEDGKQLYPREWDDKFIGVPPVIKKRQNRPSISREAMSGLAKYAVMQIRFLFILLASTGARIGEILGVEIDKHISNNFRTILISQKLRKGQLEPTVKTLAGQREIDLPISISLILRWFVGDRKSGFLFAQPNGSPLLDSHLYRDHLHPALLALGYVNKFTGNHKAGFNIFRRFRNTFLRNKVSCPEGLRAFWIGHEGGHPDDIRETFGDHEKSEKMGRRYDMIDEDLAFRLQKAEEFGIGFDLPEDLASLVPTVPNLPDSEDDTELAQNEELDWCI
jgi:integrase